MAERVAAIAEEAQHLVEHAGGGGRGGITLFDGGDRGQAGEEIGLGVEHLPRHLQLRALIVDGLDGGQQGLYLSDGHLILLHRGGLHPEHFGPGGGEAHRLDEGAAGQIGQAQRAQAAAWSQSAAADHPGPIAEDEHLVDGGLDGVGGVRQIGAGHDVGRRGAEGGARHHRREGEGPQPSGEGMRSPHDH